MLIENILEESVQKFGEVKAVKIFNRKEVLEKSYSEMMKNVISTRKGLLAEEFEGKHIALIGTSSVEWIESYLGDYYRMRDSGTAGCCTLPCEGTIDTINRSDSSTLLKSKHRHISGSISCKLSQASRKYGCQEGWRICLGACHSINELRDMGKSAAKEDASCPDAKAIDYYLYFRNHRKEQRGYADTE